MTTQEKLEHIAQHGSVDIRVSACMKNGIQLKCTDIMATSDWLKKFHEMEVEASIPKEKRAMAMRTFPNTPERLKFRGDTLKDVVDRAFAVIKAMENSGDENAQS